MRTLNTLMIAGALSVSLSACGSVGNPLEHLGKGLPPPDEFAVKKTRPLKMPAGSSDLPTPRPGARSPLEYTPRTDARNALLKDGAAAKASAPSPAERSLLTAAKAHGDRTEIKVRLATAEAKAKSRRGWVAPTVMELLNLAGGRSEDILDPNLEARRLATSGGVKAPVNPDAATPKEKKKKKTGEEFGHTSPGYKFHPEFPYGNQKKGSGGGG